MLDLLRHLLREDQQTTPVLQRGELYSEEVVHLLDLKEAYLYHHDNRLLPQGVSRASSGPLEDFLVETCKEKEAVG